MAAQKETAPQLPGGRGGAPSAVRPQRVEFAGASQPVSSRFPDCSLRNHRGAARRFRTDLIAHQRVLISFIYTRCDGICPKTVAHLAAVEKLLRTAGEVFRILSLSVDPTRDTPQDLAEYAQAHEVQHISNWEFLVASPADTVAIQAALRARDPEALAGAADLKSHSGMIVFGNDATNRWSAIAAGTAPGHILHSFQRVARAGSFASLVKLRV